MHALEDTSIAPFAQFLIIIEHVSPVKLPAADVVQLRLAPVRRGRRYTKKSS
jgi:hypothetical protein